jgi:DNA uptake protein ComE-like DNA-binding protein
MQPGAHESSGSPEPHPEDVSTRWMWLGVALPIGFGAWVPFVAGYRARNRAWMALGAGLIAFAIAAMVVSSAEDSNRFGGMLLIISWISHGAASFALRRPYARRMAIQSGYDDRVAMAEHIDAERRAMIALAASDPAKAAGLGVGRPDLPGSRHGHLVDLNHAPASVIAGLPGVSRDAAAEIAALRDELGGFDSVEDLGALMALHPRVVEAMRTRAVTLPD